MDPNRLNFYEGLIGVLRCISELGRLDILVAVSMMSRYLVSAREGHLNQLFHIFAHFKEHDRSTLVIDDTEPSFTSRRFIEADKSDYYGDMKEVIPIDAPTPIVKTVITTCFADADHAGCRVTRRSHTGVLEYVNREPILFYTQRQNTFGSEIVGLKTAIEMVEGLRYKQRMMGVPIKGSTSLFCDNDSVHDKAGKSTQEEIECDCISQSERIYREWNHTLGKGTWRN